MNSSTLFFVLFVAVFVGVFGYAIYAKIKRKNASWTGTVIDKNVTETTSTPTNNNNNGSVISFGNRSAVNTHYTLVIKDDSGKEFNWPVGQGFYESVSVGDKLSKHPGTETPTKL